jgi:hypothetical protein
MITIEVEPDQAIAIVNALRAATDALSVATRCERVPVPTIGRSKPRSIDGSPIAF